LVAVLASGCGAFNGDAEATWDVAPGQVLDVDTTTFTALVTRLGCNSGVTGDANEPTIEVTDAQVVITFTVSPGEPSSATCPGNDPVSYEVELPEALRSRELIDGACESSEAKGTEPCHPDNMRYTP
jgi:hypothetical protein